MFEARTRWRSQCNDVSRLQRHECTEKRDDRGHSEDHVGSTSVLHHRPTHPCSDKKDTN